jgi:hypothetical protein
MSGEPSPHSSDDDDDLIPPDHPIPPDSLLNLIEAAVTEVNDSARDLHTRADDALIKFSSSVREQVESPQPAFDLGVGFEGRPPDLRQDVNEGLAVVEKIHRLEQPSSDLPAVAAVKGESFQQLRHNLQTLHEHTTFVLSTPSANLLKELSATLAKITEFPQKWSLSGQPDAAVARERGELYERLVRTRDVWTGAVKEVEVQHKKFAGILKVKGAGEAAAVPDIDNVWKRFEMVLERLASHPVCPSEDQLNREVVAQTTTNRGQRRRNDQAKEQLVKARAALRVKTEAKFARIVAQHEADVELLVSAYEEQLKE